MLSQRTAKTSYDSDATIESEIGMNWTTAGIIASVLTAIFFIVKHYKQKEKHKTENVLPVTNITITHLRKDVNGMENIRVAWPLSPSNFVEKQEMFIGLDGATPSKFGSDIAANVNTIDIQLPTGKVVDLYIKVTGDNATTANSPSISFASENQEKVQPPGMPTTTWLSHSPD
jgi:hypothetical protein